MGTADVGCAGCQGIRRASQKRRGLIQERAWQTWSPALFLPWKMHLAWQPLARATTQPMCKSARTRANTHTHTRHTHTHTQTDKHKHYLSDTQLLALQNTHAQMHTCTHPNTHMFLGCHCLGVPLRVSPQWVRAQHRCPLLTHPLQATQPVSLKSPVSQ